MVVFLPVAFMGGIIGRFFYQFGVAVACAVLLSMFVSFTLDPMLSSVWPDKHKHGEKRRGFGAFLDWFSGRLDKLGDVYVALIGWALRHRRITLMIAVASLFGAFSLSSLIGKEFVPEPDFAAITPPQLFFAPYASLYLKRFSSLQDLLPVLKFVPG